jgi:peptide/nickel transport system substrate-binding protein
MPSCAAARPGRRCHHRVLAAGLSAALVALLAGCAASPPPAAPGRLDGGTATVALQPGDQFSWILPLLPFSASTGANLEYSEYLMWRPVYWFGSPRHVGLNEAESLADPAVITFSGGQTTATITLKRYDWSDGLPVTSRDVEFWFDLLKAEKANWWDYVPGEFPDNVSAFTILGPTRFSLTFTGRYSAAWLYNELGQLIPLPQQSWDKTSPHGKVGNYDQTSAGARSVYDFLATQNKNLAAYATNPLWQVVDGPWRLTGYAPATGDATYVRNPRYAGPVTGSVHDLRVIAFTSDTAEFDTLLSAGGISYGYIPFDDAAQMTRVTADGYTVQAWPTWGITYITLNYAAPQTGAIFRQLYVRQAMQHLINQAADITDFLQGDGNPTYGPVPLVPASPFISPQQARNPDPYNPAQAAALLRAHGWQITPHSTDTCTHPGTAPDECGAGIAAGARLAFSMQYADSVTGVDEETATLQSAFAQAGIRLSLAGAPFDTVVANDVPCAHAGCWQANYYGQGWYFDPAYNEPDGSAIFDSAGGSNSGGYRDPAADALMARLPSGGYPALYAYENYLAQHLPVLWMPQFDFQISAVSDTLRGVYPQDPLTNIYPENWYFVK